ncbi:helix-turn-helix domain-containing protein [Streptomyces sp. UH6]|uniref:helix-turn-helix domain-containing protein n=1 Tax=Streptomyces sp. UH6 TaxID=2748379 RepID=UPI0015D4D967|nr:helix-turn-helix domain-containing protein [Streptomyces sp. UH6]NYV73101.1 helix-turn-helix domain-containing protein [Streptomyces sp. UH6]
MNQDRTKLAWRELASAIRNAREKRGLSQMALAELAGVSEGSVQNLEKGDSRTRIPPTIAKLEPHLGWARGAGMEILEGGEPTPAPAPTEPAEKPARNLKSLPLRIVDELESDDPLLDSAVIQLPGVGGARMAVVVRGNPDATPQEIQDALLAWRRTERALRHLPGDDEDGRAAQGS